MHTMIESGQPHWMTGIRGPFMVGMNCTRVADYLMPDAPVTARFAALVLGGDGKLLSKEHFVRFGESDSPEGALRGLNDEAPHGQILMIDPDRLPEQTSRIMLWAAPDTFDHCHFTVHIFRRGGGRGLELMAGFTKVLAVEEGYVANLIELWRSPHGLDFYVRGHIHYGSLERAARAYYPVSRE